MKNMTHSELSRRRLVPTKRKEPPAAAPGSDSEKGEGTGTSGSEESEAETSAWGGFTTSFNAVPDT